MRRVCNNPIWQFSALGIQSANMYTGTITRPYLFTMKQKPEIRPN
jgi:hypothetical protein